MFFLRSFEAKNKAIDKKVRKVMKKYMEYDLKNKKLKFPKYTVHIKCVGGGFVTKRLNEEEVINYLLMPIGELTEIIPYTHKNEFIDSDVGFNKQFHDSINNIKLKYKEKALNYIEESNKNIIFWVGILTLIFTITGVIISIISLNK
ncbi:TPA: hypothetical protein ACF2DS_001943 [Clostridium perfringens]|uniref:hypothetical protein n=1 Tax=Clostridium perfringens TaxID=1502 RepID=UPI000D81D821|nr:hypothetical protein [Clostridium perfringens]MDM0594528.1 hypothetical protein [Clostridium perfringens]MDM0597590.1 hypothetical protein [Clostridium perfringens]NGT33426.1 hypothetical protein [Clostridium perfringens]NGU11155.1 hypothetical protein [Clostridium perfringens]SQB23288.1 Uncharacterised protein [Clostridium perfringens]